MRNRMIAAIIILLVAVPAHAAERCVFKYYPSGPTYSSDALPCDPGRDMGYVENDKNPFTKFHFLPRVSQERREFYAKHIRMNFPWKIVNPDVEDGP